ncbi:hypothetical protein H9I32_09705 [Bacillus sp. Xin]|uniref:hypothetical protein n=1 Tax=unclassified Bacillus (in: firmicutes) TaxID=185979 RepID=UPI001573F23A|nr:MULTISPECIES: hypothetical protein [unclassified Bacillus (in: firmicutes)]MBC6972658.1 hypothetical protein [Bacillus sp. Xin]NSW39126.1 hypothetical protein [Bacillus sp. Xin1]
MHNDVFTNLERSIFRANPEYELVSLDTLLLEERKNLEFLKSDPNHYGILKPRSSRLTPKSISEETAILLNILQQPNHLPEFVKETLQERCNQLIAKFVLDGILEVQHGESFVCGVNAYEFLYGENQLSETVDSRIPQLSRQALQYAQFLEIDDVNQLTERLYSYNRIPLSSEWIRIYPSTDVVFERLVVQSGPNLKKLLDTNWTKTSDGTNGGWLSWSLKQSGQIDRSDFYYKLYISPRPEPEFMCAAFQECTAVFTDLQVRHFKVGKDAVGLLRPDKMVAYFTTFEECEETARRLQQKLQGCPAQGTPFTAEFTKDGLLSWGMDPPHNTHGSGWQDTSSWRIWVSSRLATALHVAKATSDSRIEPWRFALQRLHLEEVNTDTWTPNKTIWQNL